MSAGQLARHAATPSTRAAPPARGGRGHIVVVSSGAGLRSFPQAAVYGATKAAQRMFAEALRHELAGTGVSVTTVYPGEIATSLHDHEKDRMPAWYRGGPQAAPPGGAGREDRRRVEDDERAVYYPPLVRLLGIATASARKAGDALLRRLRGDRAPRRGAASPARPLARRVGAQPAGPARPAARAPARGTRARRATAARWRARRTRRSS